MLWDGPECMGCPDGRGGGSEPMRLVVTLLVRDEIDVIAATMEHYLAAGVDAIVVTDNGSVDGTAELLARYAATGPVDVLSEPEHTYQQSAWVTRMARRACVEHGADWVLNVDADEFLWPLAEPVPLDVESPDLVPGPGLDVRPAFAALPAGVGRVRVRRHNLVAAPERRGNWPRRLVERDVRALSERGTRIADKIVHRADPAVVVAQGNHAIEGAEGSATVPTAEFPLCPFVYLHVPDRSYAQFERKIANGGAAYERSGLPADVGWHWRLDYQRLREGTLREHWEQRQPTRAAIDAGHADGVVVPDERLTDRLEWLRDRALLPDALGAVLADDRPGSRLPRLISRWRRRSRR